MRMIKVNVDGTDQLVPLREFAALVAADNQMTDAERDAATGLFTGIQVYNSTSNKMELLTPTGWEVITSAPDVAARKAKEEADKRAKEEAELGAKKDAKDAKDGKADAKDDKKDAKEDAGKDVKSHQDVKK